MIFPELLIVNKSRQSLIHECPADAWVGLRVLILIAAAVRKPAAAAQTEGHAGDIDCCHEYYNGVYHGRIYNQ